MSRKKLLKASSDTLPFAALLLSPALRLRSPKHWTFRLLILAALAAFLILNTCFFLEDFH